MPDWNTPLTVKNVTFPNRVVMAPVLPFGWQAPEGRMHERVLRHYLMRADQGIGLLIMQALLVSPDYDVISRAGAWDDSHKENIARIAQACHEGGTRLFVQLAHAGFDAGGGGGRDIHDLSDEQMHAMGQAFVRAVRRVKEAGCDGVELHCAHGSFLNAVGAAASNHRAGRYGGDLAGRLSLLREIADGVREFLDDDFILSARMGWNEDVETDRAMALAMQEMGFEMLHVSGGIPAEREIDLPAGTPYNEFVYTAVLVKAAVDVPVIAVNDIRTLRRGEALLQAGLCDMVAYAKPFLADKAFLRRSAEDMDYEPCLRCKVCQWRTDGENCPVRRRTDS